jgi:crossover junction endodeoxyribonuclease RuvC
VEWGCWRTPAGRRPELRLKTIFDGVQDLIAEFAPDAVALEESFVGVDARTALSVGQARGAVMVAASTALSTHPRA